MNRNQPIHTIREITPKSAVLQRLALAHDRFSEVEQMQKLLGNIPEAEGAHQFALIAFCAPIAPNSTTPCRRGYDPRQPRPLHLPPLPARQAETLATYARTGRVQFAADSMGIAYHTAHQHLDRAYRRLGVTNAIEAFRVLGWLSVPR
jgi:DNA-binding NarL/FixJ family response regulator